MGVLWRVVSVGSKLLSPHSQMYTSVAILLDLLYTTVVTSCLLVAMISGTARVVISVLLPRQLPSLVPGPALLVGNDLGDSGAVW